MKLGKINPINPDLICRYRMGMRQAHHRLCKNLGLKSSEVFKLERDVIGYMDARGLEEISLTHGNMKRGKLRIRQLTREEITEYQLQHFT